MLSKLTEVTEGKSMNKNTLFVKDKMWRLLIQGNTAIYTIFFVVLWANERFTINLFNYAENYATISKPSTMLTFCVLTKWMIPLLFITSDSGFTVFIVNKFDVFIRLLNIFKFKGYNMLQRTINTLCFICRWYKTV